jgi:hypothetical protein
VDGHGRSAWLFLPVDSDDRSEALGRVLEAITAMTVRSAPAAVVGPEGTVPRRPPGGG